MALTTYALLHAVWQGHLSPEDAAATLGIPVRNVKTQVNYLGGRLEGIAQALDNLTAANYPSRHALAEAKAAAAAQLGVSTRQVNRFLKRAGGNPRPDPIKQREEASTQASERKRDHRKLAIDVLFGRKTLTEAANLAGRHERSIRRVLDELPIPVRYPDYEHLTASTRYALAKNVEENIACPYLETLVNAQIGRIEGVVTPQTVEKPLLSMLIAWLEGETTQYDPGYENFLERYGLKGVKLSYWERSAVADELRNLL